MSEIGRLWRDHPVLVLIAAVALPFGLYARFKGLDTWPLGIDEYYIAQSVQNLLRAGWPAYECGGFYPRALLMQYLTAALQLIGLGPELAPRLIAALGSLIVLPAAYLIGTRVHSRTVGLLAVIVLTLSVWEVEMARFARMYTPFQAVFAWYAVFFIKYTVDRETRALWGMAALSVIGILVWEGGAFLAMANFLPPFLMQTSGRLSRKDGWYFIGATALLLPIYLFVTNKFHFLGAQPFPPEYVLRGHRAHVVSQTVWRTLLQHPLISTLAAIPLLFSVLALRWIGGFRSRWLAAAGLAAVLCSALLHQFMLAVAAVLLLLLMDLVRWRELFSVKAWPFWAAIGVSALFWFSYGMLTSDWHTHEALVGVPRPLAVAYELLRFPDVIMQVARPWARAIPGLSLALLALIASACIYAIRRDKAQDASLPAWRAVLILLLSMVLAASAAQTPRSETRYVFFLYPLAVVMALAMLARFSEIMIGQARARHAMLLAGVLGLGGFALTEDFRPYHLTHVDEEAIHFRTHLTTAQASHLNARSNVRAAADWLKTHVHDDDLVINSYQSLEFYYPGVDFYFMDIRDPRFIGWSCSRGTVARWNNRPLLYTVATLQARVAAAPRVYFVSDVHKVDEALVHLQQWRPKIIWQRDSIAIVSLDTRCKDPINKRSGVE